MVQFDNHTMRIMEIDGVYTVLRNAQQIRTSPAQRYTFLLSAEPFNNVNYAFLVSFDVNKDYTAPGAIYELNATGQIIYDSTKAPGPPLLAQFVSQLLKRLSSLLKSLIPQNKTLKR